MNHLVRPEPAVFDPSAYTDRGKLMDGWEAVGNGSRLIGASFDWVFRVGYTA